MSTASSRYVALVTVSEAEDRGQGSDAAENDTLAFRGVSELPTLNINGRDSDRRSTEKLLR